MKSSLIKPNEFHLYTGPMFSGKTRDMLTYTLKFDDHNIRKDDKFKIKYLCFKPEFERGDGPFIVSRGYKGQNIIKKPAHLIPDASPQKMFDIYNIALKKGGVDAIVIDEPQFFNEGICDVADVFKNEGLMVLASGLLFDYTHNYFGPMGELLKHATEVFMSTATCSMNNCIIPATHTQRLIASTMKPAPLGDLKVGKNKDFGKINTKAEFDYEPRCFKHFVHPSTVLNSYK
jgi:thymidine kinase